MQDDMRGEMPRLAIVDEVGFVPDGTDADAQWAEKAAAEAAEIAARKDAAVAGEPNRAWRNRVKRQIRQQIKANEGSKGDTLIPSARTLFERRHAVLEVLSESGGAARVTYLRACTCEIGAPHTEYGRRLQITDTEGFTR